MLIAEYHELTLSEINQNIIPVIQENKVQPSIEHVIEMLTMWGAYNRYKSRCGYKRISAIFSSLYPTKNFHIIEDSIDIIENIILELKNSISEKQQLQYAIIEAYYKGIDLVVDGYDWSQKLTIRDIAEYLNLPKSTVSNRKKSAEQFVFNQLLKLS